VAYIAAALSALGTHEMPNRSSPDASMSALELRALRYLWRGLPDLVDEANRELLVRMGLARVNIGGTLDITEAGAHRFTVERHRSDLRLAGPDGSQEKAA
jgi:hypothetical protein